MTNKNEKFIKRNQEIFDDMMTYFKDNYDKIRLILVSPEIGIYLTLFGIYSEEEYQEVMDRMIITTIDDKSIRFIIDPYMAADKVQFVMKGKNEIRFDVPCICGIYSDEKHP